jgi:hypothetical protein
VDISDALDVALDINYLLQDQKEEINFTGTNIMYAPADQKGIPH